MSSKLSFKAENFSLKRTTKWWPTHGSLLVIVHSERLFDLSHATEQFLSERFELRQRMKTFPSGQSLAPIADAVPYRGSLSIWSACSLSSCEGSSECWGLKLLAYGTISHDKPQHAVFRGPVCYLLGTHTLGRYSMEISPDKLYFSLIQDLQDTWLSGAHMLSIGLNHEMAVTASGAEGILFADTTTLRVSSYFRCSPPEGALLMPISREDDLREHYPTGNLQLYHLNSVQMLEDGFAYTTLSGIVCRTTFEGTSRLYENDALGAHAIRSISRDRFMFVVSPKGEIRHGNWEKGVTSIHSFNSKWIHDAIFLDSRRILAADAENNRILLASPKTGEVLDEIGLEGLGEAPQFMDVSPLTKLF